MSPLLELLTRISALYAGYINHAEEPSPTPCSVSDFMLSNEVDYDRI